MSAEPFNLPSMEDHLNSLALVDGQRVLDVGCGDGWFVRHLIAQGGDAVGLECGVEMLRRAVAADSANPGRYIDGVGQAMPFEDDQFDAVFFVFSLHHVPEHAMATALGEAVRVTRTGGLVHILEPVAKGLGHAVDALVDDETHVRELAQQAIEATFAAVLSEIDNRALTMASPYRDYAHYEHVLVGIDPERAATIDAVRSLVEQLFYANAVEHDGQWWFEDHLLIRSFQV